MGRIIRRTVTITITETWTITWTTDETAPPQGTTVVPDQPKPQGEPDETILPVVTPSPTDTQPPDMSPKSGAGRQRKRTRRRRPVDPGAE